MANQEHLELLQQGSDVWNEWRRLHPEVKPDLTEAKLSRAILSDADLSDADLSRAILSRANLIGAALFIANLSGANLIGATLGGAGLIGATLSDANLSGATLSDADLSGATLSRADLSGATLSRADLSGANLSGATLSRANLNGATLSRATLSRVNLSRATLIGATLSRVNLSRATLSRANLNGADLFIANLSGAILSGAILSRANLNGADLSGADLSDAYLLRANLSGANLSKANLSGADLSRATLVDTNLTYATLTQCTIYGISVWNVQLEGAKQDNLVITDDGEPTITVDNLKIAQFIYLLLNNDEIRDVIDTIAKKAVLILGRFTPERKAVLDAIKEALRTDGYMPILFDFEKPHSRNFTETVSALAHLSRFIIADLTDPSSVPHELATIVPTLVIPIVPLFHPIDRESREYAMFRDLSLGRAWVLPIHHYTALEDLLATLQTHIIKPAERKAQELITLKNSP